MTFTGLNSAPLNYIQCSVTVPTSAWTFRETLKQHFVEYKSHFLAKECLPGCEYEVLQTEWRDQQFFFFFAGSDFLRVIKQTKKTVSGIKIFNNRRFHATVLVNPVLGLRKKMNLF